jgi:ABC-type bacteriocin/lantibiotic exporter with double-glycine peptidase domain
VQRSVYENHKHNSQRNKKGTHPQTGTPYSRIARLRSADIDVAYHKASGLEELGTWLARELPVIAFVQMRELPYWQGHWSQHAVVVVGIDQATVYLLDPATHDQARAVSCGDFMLAWEEMDLAYAVIAKHDVPEG